jgi:NADH dehydrogenase FAD-containing subunit
MGKTVVILGGAFAGLKIAHTLLQKTLPSVTDLKVILISSSSHVYWNIASPRAVIPGLVPDEKIFQPIQPGFAKYSSSNFEFVLGTAESVDPKAKKVEIETESGAREVAYDILVVTTGSRAIGNTPWKQVGSYEASLALLHETQEKVKNAKSIVVGGGGVTGVETAGELGFEYGKTKEIILVSGSFVRYM